MSTFMNDDMDIVRPFQGRWMSVLCPWVATHGYSHSSPSGKVLLQFEDRFGHV